MGRKSIREIRRKEIIQVFYDVAVNEGLENTSIAKIASEMECNPSLIIHYFKSKEEMIYDLIDFILEKYFEIFKLEHTEIESRQDLLEILERLFSKAWNNLIDDGVFYACFALTFSNDSIKRKFLELHEKLRWKLAELLRITNEKGFVNINDAEKKAEIFFVLLEGAYYYTSLIRDKDMYDRKMDEYKKFTLSLLDL
jgi:AcrR family transcriptional regulator